MSFIGVKHNYPDKPAKTISPKTERRRQKRGIA
jgi:hypothetical protein